MLTTKSIILFILAGLCEIGGGYLVWFWLREGKGILIGILGGDSFGALRNNTDSSARSLWKGLCSLRWCICNNVHSLGMEDRQNKS
ncbi:MAG: hypothetical protein SCARUB_03140 [Candidatus Scalindua rubra]|uniref:Uncharacterized protein n=1 Tax=Candidatus Scalindua rubra TaxID=1872076 RepID=A0A1E3X7Y6_9BACT|nr:MAG: hypothetical protein SCARUB_03140 [Candidatus Scalindua rubra]